MSHQIGSGKQPARDRLFKDRALDRFVGQLRIAPPPGIALQGFGGGEEAVHYGVEIGLGARAISLFQKSRLSPIPSGYLG